MGKYLIALNVGIMLILYITHLDVVVYKCLRLFHKLIHRKEQHTLSLQEAEKLLVSCSPYPGGTSIGHNLILANQYKDKHIDIQIIVPIYNVSKYLKECIDSILNQETKYSILLVLVDDGSIDDSGAIADSYADDLRVKVIHQSNRGLPGARNAGLKEIYGEYITFVDSDDKLFKGGIDALIDKAKEKNADIVQGGYYCEYYRCNFSESLSYTMIPNFAWGKLYRNTLFENRIFMEGYYYEDQILPFSVFPLAKKIVFCKDIVYYYRYNERGIVYSSDLKKVIHSVGIIMKATEEREKMNLPKDEEYLHLLTSRVQLLFFAYLSKIEMNKNTNLDSENVEYAIYLLLRNLFIKEYELVNNMKDIKQTKIKRMYSIMKNGNYHDWVVAMRTYVFF